MRAIVVALFLFVFFVAAEAQAVQRPEENADVRAVCRADDPRVKMKLKEDLPPAILGGGASRGAEEFESADPQPWMGEKFPLSDGTDAGSEACWLLFRAPAPSIAERPEPGLRLRPARPRGTEAISIRV